MKDCPAFLAAGEAVEMTWRVGPLPLRWRARIVLWDAPHVFVEIQEEGPYASWWHEHHFRADGETTVLEDRIYYALPFGTAGALAHALAVRRALARTFAFRAQAIALRFGS